MAQNPPAGHQRVVPMLSYENAPAAIDFLCKAFGFQERSRMPMPDGRIGHAEVGYQDNVVMLASEYPEMGLASPQNVPTRHCQLMCYVDDVDAHFARARKAGATIASEPSDQPHGDREYRVVDPEGHHWSFSTRLREMSADEITAAYAGK